MRVSVFLGGTCVYALGFLCLYPTVNNTVQADNNIACDGFVQQPVCARQQVQCIKAPCYPIKQTFANRCEMQSADAQYLYNGVCEEGESWEVQKNTLVQKIENRIATRGEKTRSAYIKALNTRAYSIKTNEAKLLREVAATLQDNLSK